MPPADADSLLAALAPSPLTVGATELHAMLDAYLSRIEGLQKGGSVSAAHAKKEGPALIKATNTSLKQVCLPSLSQ